MSRLKEKLQKLDLECLKYQLVTREGWSLEKADYVEKLYKAYLYVAGTQKDFMPVPTRDIDEFWHTHILDTEKYANDCKNLFGTIVHHYPYVGIFDGQESFQEDGFQKMRQILISEFGLDPTLEITKAA